MKKLLIIIVILFIISCSHSIRTPKGYIKVKTIFLISPQSKAVIEQNDLAFNWTSISDAVEYKIVIGKIEDHKEFIFYTPTDIKYNTFKNTPQKNEYFNVIHKETVRNKTNIKFIDFFAKFDLSNKEIYGWRVYDYDDNNNLI